MTMITLNGVLRQIANMLSNVTFPLPTWTTLSPPFVVVAVIDSVLDVHSPTINHVSVLWSRNGSKSAKTIPKPQIGFLQIQKNVLDVILLSKRMVDAII